MDKDNKRKNDYDKEVNEIASNKTAVNEIKLINPSDIHFPYYIAMGAPMGRMRLEEPTDVKFVVRLKGELIGLDNDELLIWVRSLFYATDSELKSWCEQHGLLFNVESKIKSMETSGLLLHFEKDEDVKKILSRTRLIPAGIGLGRTVLNPESFEIGDFTQKPIVKFDLLSYLIWVFSDGTNSIEEAINKACHRLGIQPELGIKRVGFLLPQLMITRVSYIDIIRVREKS